MKVKILLVLTLSILNLSLAQARIVQLPFQKSNSDCDISVDYNTDCFRSRLIPTVRVVLVAYGSILPQTNLIKIGNLLKERFDSSTDGIMNLEIVDTAIIELKKYPRDVTELRNAIRGEEARRSPERLERLWYYDNVVETVLLDEIQSQLIAGGMKPSLEKSDAVLVVSGPQFEGLGFASGAYALTEQPSEMAWMTSDGGKTVIETDEHIVDEFLHEVGHVLGLDHASAACFGTMTGPDRYKCCQTSPGRSDVMSYCRDRSRVQGPYYYRYTNCTKEYLKDVVSPNLLNGGPRLFQTTPCE